MIRLALLLTALWAVVAAPALCATGVLAHECPCEDERACEHESDCDADPCSDLLLRRDEALPDVDPSPAALAGTCLPPACELPVASTRNPPPPPAAPPSPRHASDVPLLS